MQDRIDSLSALDNLLDGNSEPVQQQEPEQEIEPQDQEPESEPESEPEPQFQTDKQNAAFAKMRVELNQTNKALRELAKALGIEEVDPVKQRDKLLELAYEKLAEQKNVPKELYKELTTTKEQLAMLQMQQNQAKAKEKLMDLASVYELDKDELIKFARQLDEQGINLIENPDVDLEYYYYRMNRQAIEEKKIQKAVEEALKRDKQNSQHSSTPNKQSAKGGNDEPPKINSVDALNALLDGK